MQSGDAGASPDRLRREHAQLLVIDMQPRLLRTIPAGDVLVWNVRRLLDGARLLAVPRVGTEQYPQGLGPTEPTIAERLAPLVPKREFSCWSCLQTGQWLDADRPQICVAGAETHVCVLQTAIDLLSAGYDVHLVVDAIGARRAVDHDTAIRRLEAAGAVLTTVETVLFQWCRTSLDPQFKAISELVRQQPPE
jgi:nicotinamidase-related amidase